MASTQSIRSATTSKTKKILAKDKTVKKLVPRTTTATATTARTSTPDVDLKQTGKHKVHHKKQKTVRDSFNMPENDYALIGVLKIRAINAAHHVKKSELFRAGLHALAAMKDADFMTALTTLDSVKTGRPAKKIK